MTSQDMFTKMQKNIYEMPGNGWMVTNVEELKEVQLAALLHDIGKFEWRCGKAHHEKYDEVTKGDCLSLDSVMIQ